jgi:hypothetical protein
MKISKWRIRKLINEAILKEMTPDIIGGSDSMAASRQADHASESGVPIELLEAVISTMPPFDYVIDGGRALYHATLGVEKMMKNNEAGAREEFEEAGKYAIFFCVPGILEFLLKAIKPLIGRLNSAESILEAALKEAKKSPELNPTSVPRRDPTRKWARTYNFKHWNNNAYKANAYKYNKKLMSEYSNKADITFKAGKYKGFTPLGIDSESGMLKIANINPNSTEIPQLITAEEATEGIMSNMVLQSVFSP